VELAGKVVVVAEGGNGIGSEVLDLSRRGARVAPVDIPEEGVKGTAGMASINSLRSSP
jgi:hypothetical protein